ncbi:M23 family metallopeptidase [Nocardia stercoris]|uniref:M23 family metallopeptidase n=2 Tax=Nocardia stercoris TaxID=2483361 RepID=A0A3M2KXA4_9NOCA|nr:M23 family metallopeptidase [Nocardia stercoris]
MYDEYAAPVEEPVNLARLETRRSRRESRGKAAGFASSAAEGETPAADRPARRGSRSAAAASALTIARLPVERSAEPAGEPDTERRSGGAHRLPAPPAALKGRAAVVAMAAGAVVAAGQAGSQVAGAKHNTAEADAAMHQQLAAQTVSLTGASSVVGDPAPEPGASSPAAPQILNAAPVGDLSQFQDILQHGEKFANDLQAAVDAKFRPLYSKFANGTYTSGYGSRWGAMHPGVDIAAPIGTPIYAVEDGTVIDAGPADGFGMWVRLKHADGTVTVYGHVDTTTVSVGDHVMAGDQIATVGNRGFSTGPHCHFEVWLNGTDRIDPQPWLASRGIALGPQGD